MNGNIINSLISILQSIFFYKMYMKIKKESTLSIHKVMMYWSIIVLYLFLNRNAKFYIWNL